MRKNLATTDHITALINEVDYLKTLIQPQDTGHIHTTISVLERHIYKLLKEMENGNNT